jgi:hypothetical protein
MFPRRDDNPNLWKVCDNEQRVDHICSRYHEREVGGCYASSKQQLQPTDGQGGNGQMAW